MRERRNVDWFQRQLFGEMERRVVISAPSHGCLKIQLSPKLFSSGALLLKLDGKVYPFGLDSPLGGSTPIAKTMQAWACGPVFLLRTTLDAQGKLRNGRAHWLHAPGVLRSVHWYEEEVSQAEARVVPAAETLKARFGDWIVGHVVTYEMHAEPAAAASSSSS